MDIFWWLYACVFYIDSLSFRHFSLHSVSNVHVMLLTCFGGYQISAFVLF